MTTEESYQVAVGDRVEWRADLAENQSLNGRGTVIEVNGAGFEVRFDDGEEVGYAFGGAHLRKLHRV